MSFPGLPVLRYLWPTCIVTRFLLSHAGIQTSQTHLLAALHTAETHLLLSQSLLAHLESANVYNDVFQIGHVPLHPADKGSITVGTINGLRLGGRPVVDWDEINAGWGLVALCLDRIGMRVGCVFEGSVVCSPTAGSLLAVSVFLADTMMLGIGTGSCP